MTEAAVGAPAARAAPTKAAVRMAARHLMRSCIADAGQFVDEGVVERQAEKIVRHLWPSIRRAWQEQ